MRKLLLGMLWPALAAALLLLAALACGAAEEEAAPIDTSGAPTGGPPYSAIVVTSDLAVGRGRLAFGIVDSANGMPVRAETAQVSLYRLPPGSDERVFRQSLTAEFLAWPTAGAGVFVAWPEFDAAGTWQLEAMLDGPDGAAVSAAAAFAVREESRTPAVGAPAPRSRTAKAADVPDLSHISSDPHPDPAFYRLSVDEALDEGRPLVVVFATPAYCVSATCGPQLAELAKVRDRYAEQANFIHVEIFQNPHLLEGRRAGAARAAATHEWGLPTEPWTFVVGADGRIAAKFEQFIPAAALEQALAETLR